MRYFSTTKNVFCRERVCVLVCRAGLHTFSKNNRKSHLVTITQFLMKNSEAVLKSALRSVPPSGFKQGSCAGTVNVKDTGWDEIGGLQGVKRELQSALLWPSKFPEHYRTLGLQRPTGVLLYGPPGCGKTSIVKAVARYGQLMPLYLHL